MQEARRIRGVGDQEHGAAPLPRALERVQDGRYIRRGSQQDKGFEVVELVLRGAPLHALLDVKAALHDLDERFSQGRPIRMRLLAQKGAPATIDPDPAAALGPVIEAYVVLRQAAILRNVAS